MMTTNTTRTATELSIDFLSWVNAELRKRIETEEVQENEREERGFVNRVKAYLTGAAALTLAIAVWS